MSKKYFTPFPLPSPYERELLIILIEECAEVQQRITKMLRFGKDEIEPGQRMTNAQRLELELGDLFALVAKIVDAGLVDEQGIKEQGPKKLEKLAKYMQTGDGKMTAETRTSRRIEYWSSVMLKPWAEFHLVPATTILGTAAFFDEQVAAIKRAGFSYRIIETVETIVEERAEWRELDQED